MHAGLALERTAQLAELRRGGEQYRLLLENLNDVVFSARFADGSPAGAIHVLDGPIEEMTVYPRAAFAADPDLWQRLVRPDDLAAFTAAIADLTGAQRFITTLKELGRRFALDDFGVDHA